MAAPNYARFRINATPSTQGYYEATNAQSLVFDLEDASRVLTVTYAAYSASDSTSPLATLGAPQFNFSNASYQVTKSPASSSDTTTAPSPGGGAAWIIRATASLPGGVHVFERKLYVRNGNYGLVIPGETTQGGPRGWADEVLQGSNVPANVSVTGTFALAGVITPATITAQQNDYAPTGGSTSCVWRLSSNAEQFITGIANPADGRVIRLVNVGVNPIGLATDHPSSAAANRFIDMPGVADSFGEAVYLQPNEALDIWYDPSILRWRYVTRAKNVLGDITFSTGPMAADTHNLNRFQGNYVRLSANAGPFNLTGMSAGTDRMLVVLHNPGSNAFNLAHENASSTAANRFSLPGAAAYSVAAGASVTLIYDGPSVRWKLANPTGGGSVPVDLVATETFALAGVLTPATITADQNDYAPSGIADATTLRLSTNANGRRITGIAGGTAGRILILENVGSFELAILPQSGSSTAANRIIAQLGGNGEYRIQPTEAVVLMYDGVDSRWRMIGQLSAVLGKWTFSGALNANTNNYGRFGSNFIRIDPDLSGPWKVTGLEAAVNDREVCVVSNIDATGASFRISHEDAGSTAANRFLLPVPEIILRNGESATFIYDLIGSSRWRLAHVGGQAYPGDIQSASITSDQNDYTFSGLLTTSSVLRVSPDANGRRITGISATGVGLGREIIIVNVAAFTLVLQNESASSSAANRIALPFDQVIIPPSGSIRLIYDTTSTRWRPAGTEGGPIFTRGANLTDANQTLQVSGGVDYQLPYGTLTASRDKTLGNTSPGTGTVITIRRFDKQAFTLVVKNHDAATLFTFASATPGEADFRFDGTNWVHAGYKPYPT